MDTNTIGLTRAIDGSIIPGKGVLNMATKQSIRQMRFDKESTKLYRVRLNIRTDADVIEMLDSQESKQGYIKQLIRADIAKQKETE